MTQTLIEVVVLTAVVHENVLVVAQTSQTVHDFAVGIAAFVQIFMRRLSADRIQQTQRSRTGIRRRGVKVLEADIKLLENFVIFQTHGLQVVVGK